MDVTKEINIITGCKELPRLHIFMQTYRKMCNDCHVDFYVVLNKKRQFILRFYLVDVLGLGRYDVNKMENAIQWIKDSMVEHTEIILAKESMVLNPTAWENIKMTYYGIISKLCEENR